MYCVTAVLTALCVGLVAAMPTQVTSTAPAVSALPSGTNVKWTLDDVSRERTRENKTCEWAMAISQSPPFSPPPANSTDAAVHCSFKVRVADGTDCGVAAFPRKRCSPSHHGFYVSAGHNEDGFMVVLVENLDENTMAFFGFADDVLDSGDDVPPQTSQVTESYAAMSSGTLSRRRSNGRDVTSAATMWTVQSMTRHISSTTAVSVHMEFNIYVGNNDPEPAACRIGLQTPEGVDPATWSWYDKPCGGSEYRASWGYLKSSDAGILTLVSPARDGQAYFGFDNISMSETLGSSGPSPVEPRDPEYEL